MFLIANFVLAAWFYTFDVCKKVCENFCNKLQIGNNKITCVGKLMVKCVTIETLENKTFDIEYSDTFMGVPKKFFFVIKDNYTGNGKRNSQNL